MRRKAAAKFADPSEWLFADEALQQATAEPVAAHRARRLAGAAVHDATCSIGTELAALRNSAAYVVGSDIDPVRLAMAAHNVADVDLCRADALRPVTRDTVVLVDPSRRSGGRRRFDPRDYTPALDALLDVYRSRDLVVKCAPGIDFDEVSRLGFRGEIEVTSLAGSVREACLWSAGLAGGWSDPPSDDAGHRRRRSPTPIQTTAPWRLPAGGSSIPTARWCAQVWCGTTRTRHGLWQLDPDIAYLSGDRLPENVRGFEVLEELNYSERRLRQALSARRRRCRRDPGSRCRCRPRCVAGATAASRIATGLGRHRPHRIRGGKPGNGIHLSSLTVVFSAPRVGGFFSASRVRGETPRRLAVMRRCRSRCRLSRTSDDAHSQGGCDSRGRCTGLLYRHIDGCRRSRRAPTSAVRSGPTGSAPSMPPNSTYTLNFSFPNDYPDQAALTGYLTQARDGFVNVADNPDAYNLPYELDAKGAGYSSGSPTRRHSERGLHDVAERRRRAPADVLPVLQLGCGQEGADHIRHPVQAGHQAARRDLPGRRAGTCRSSRA